MDSKLNQEICINCGNPFTPRPSTAEDKLLRAIFGNKAVCPWCTRQNLDKCSHCGEPLENPFFLDGTPYCKEHLPYA